MCIHIILYVYNGIEWSFFRLENSRQMKIPAIKATALKELTSKNPTPETPAVRSLATEAPTVRTPTTKAPAIGTSATRSLASGGPSL